MAKAKKTSKLKKKVGFRFQLISPEAKAVYLAGDFNEWDIKATPMEKDSSGCWQAEVDLAPGVYEYRYYVDGAWQDDPEAPSSVPNPFGSRNCVLSI
jgi:1,4-alpha-glucan branching enzyme